MELTEKRKKQAKKIILIFSILTFGSGYILYLSLRFLFYEMARNKRNWLFTLRTEGEIKAVMRGNTCEQYVMRVENWRIDPDGFDLFKGSFESYARRLVKARARKLVEDPAFVEKKLRLDTDSNPLLLSESGSVIPTNRNGEPIDADGNVLDVKGYYQLADNLKRVINEANSTTLFEEIFGVVWVGFTPYWTFKYPYRWIKFGQEKAVKGVASGKVDMFPRDELVDSLFWRYPQYGVVVDEVETGAGSLAFLMEGSKVKTKVQVIAKFVFETITYNPQKTLFRTAALSSAGDWQQALVREIYDRVRAWLGRTDWDTLVQGPLADEQRTQESVVEALRKICLEINGVDEDDLPLPDAAISAVRDYGQKIVKISMIQVNLKDKSLQEAYEQVFKAEKKRDADIAKADGDRALAAAPVKGEADGLELIGNIPGGREMYMAKQLGNIRVYAPGRDGLLLNIAEEVTGELRQEKKPKTPASSGENDKKEL